MLVSGEGVAIPPGGESLTQILVHAPAMGELRELLPIESASDAAIRFGTIPIWIRVNGDVPRVYSKPDAVQLSLYDTDEVNHEFSVVAIEPKDSEYWIASWRLEGLEQATVIVRQVDEQPDASSGALIRKYHLQLGGSVPTHSGSGGGGYSAKVIGRIDAAGAEVAAIPLQIIRRSAVRFVPQSITLSMEHPLQRVFLIQPDQEQKQFIPDLRSPELTVIPVRSTDGVAFDVKLANEYLGMSGSWDETIEFVGPASGDKLSLPVRIRGRE